MPVAGGCLTMKNECDARLFLHDAWLFLLTLVTFSYFFTGGKFWQLLFTGFRGKVCYLFYWL
jgi:hypothetical protein